QRGPERPRGVGDDHGPGPERRRDAHRDRDALGRMPLVQVVASLHDEALDALQGAGDEHPRVALDGRGREAGDLRVRDADWILDVRGRLTLSAAQDEQHSGAPRDALPQVGDGGGEVEGSRAHRIIPAMVAVRNAASAPPIIARRPSRARSLRRDGAMPPMPPIWMAIEAKFAKPHSAYDAMITDRGDRSAPSPTSVASWR